MYEFFPFMDYKLGVVLKKSLPNPSLLQKFSPTLCPKSLIE